jgi:hypothetical protein
MRDASLAQRAKQFTSKLTFGKDVTVKTFGHDKYRGRPAASSPNNTGSAA